MDRRTELCRAGLWSVDFLYSRAPHGSTPAMHGTQVVEDTSGMATTTRVMDTNKWFKNGETLHAMGSETAAARGRPTPLRRTLPARRISAAGPEANPPMGSRRRASKGPTATISGRSAASSSTATRAVSFNLCATLLLRGTGVQPPAPPGGAELLEAQKAPRKFSGLNYLTPEKIFDWPKAQKKNWPNLLRAGVHGGGGGGSRVVSPAPTPQPQLPSC